MKTSRINSQKLHRGHHVSQNTIVVYSGFSTLLIRICMHWLPHVMMDVLNGLTFKEARKRVTKAFRDSVESSASFSDDSFSFSAWKFDGYSYGSSIPTVVVILAYGLALILLKFEYADLLVVVCILTIITLLNFISITMYKQAEKREFARSLFDILSAYESSTINTASIKADSPQLTDPLLASGPTLSQDDFKTKAYLSSGHSQVSIVHTYRDGQWMRLPVLLLAEGDIIALMGGDVTPGKCYEIERVTGAAGTSSSHQTAPADEQQHLDDQDNTFSKNPTSWVIGRMVNAGEKVHIRNRQQFSQQKPAQHQHQHHHHTSNQGETVAEEVVQETLHFGERHRSLAAESVEILGLCGDVRCFQMAETPIVAFLQSSAAGLAHSGLLNGSSGSPRAAGPYSVVPTSSASEEVAGSPQTPSLIRTLFHTIVVKEGNKMFLAVGVLTVVITIVRALLVNQSDLGATSYRSLSYDDWVSSILLPSTTASLFFLPLALPVALILAEALATSSVLANAEITLRPPAVIKKKDSSSAASAIGVDSLGSSSGGGTADSGHKDSTQPLLGSKAAASTNKNKSRNGSHGSESSAQQRRDTNDDDDNDDAEMEDEFMDEDIDERAEDIAESISTQVRWSRFFGYLGRVLWHRLFLGLYPSAQESCCKCCPSGAHCTCTPHGAVAGESEDDAYLPIPLARTRLLEVLGAVTMVCFVDDDVICEGYSVTEEIFLLMDNPQLGDTAQSSQKHKSNSANLQQQQQRGGGAGNSNRNRGGSTDEAETAGGATDLPAAGMASENKQVTSSAAVKGIVLDLHANPEATGSRFENPQWWRYLPSLKPLGLNAMLTYNYTAAETFSQQESAQRQASNGDGNQAVSGAHHHRSNSNHLPYPSAVQRSAQEGVTTGSDQNPLLLSQAAQFQNQHQQTERSLVRHIRHLLPPESLRELAEEIGFEQSDLSAFSRVLEVNVLAPGLENAHLLEDTHQWGQEESRRRGSLLPQLRGGVYKDFRDGSLQMMLLGDPSLVLNYCREYWDGSTRSITPLSSADRAEVLNVYERWRLEDFEVVAFCYSPVPTGGLQPLLSKEDAASQAAISSLTRHSSTSVSGVNAHSATAGGGNGRAASLAAVGRAASVISPFVPAKHNTLFFVDPITTQDLHRIAAGITSKSKGGGGLKANTHRNNSVNAAQGTQVVKSNENNHQDQEDAVEGDHPRDDGNQDASLYDFYPDNKNGEDGTVSKDTHEVEERSSSAAAMPRAASFTLTTSADLPSLTRSSPSDQHTATARRSGEATPVKNPLRATDDINYIPEAHTSRSPAHSPPQGQSKNAYPPQPPAAEDEAHPPAGSPNTAMKSNRSRSDASYTGHTATALRLAKAGHLITKSMSLDRVSEYVHVDQRLGGSEDHREGDAAGLGKHTHTHTDEDSLCVSDGDSLLLPVPLPGALRVSTSDRDVRVKEHGGKDKVIAQQQGQGRVTYQPRTPVLHFPDDDDASSVASSVLTPSTISSAQTGKSVFGRAATVETSNPTRFSAATAATGIGVRFGLLDSEEEVSPTDLGLTLDPVDALEQPDSGGFSPVSESDADAVVKRNSSFTRSHTFHVTAPPQSSSSNSEKLHASGTMTPPLVPRNSFQTAKSTTVNALLSPTLRQNASEYAHPQHRFHHPRHHHMHNQVGGMYSGHVTTSKQRHAQQVQRSHQQSRQLRRASTRQLWTQMRQQVFLGMAASSVPVRKDVPNTKEDLDSAGVRFVYFSAQNMKRSKPVAEKIGIPFDWNCAISLRELEGGTEQDPHRHISNYADWDVLAHMPHGIEAIKTHIQNVDNVPLLVSLFTDATPVSVRQMVEVFRDNGEVVLTIGGGYRSSNHAIYGSSDVSCSVSVLPGLGNTSILPASEKELIEQFPVNSECSLNRADVLLSFRLIGLNTINLLQTPYREDLSLCGGTSGCQSRCKCRRQASNNNRSPGSAAECEPAERPFVINMSNDASAKDSAAITAAATEHLRLSVLLEVIRKGRILLRNMHQALAFFSVATLSLSVWPLVSLLVPLSLPPSPPPGLALLFHLIYVPGLCLTLLQCGEPEGVMKNTPRKNQLLQRPRDVARFCWYLALRSGYVLLSIAIIGWLAAASTMRASGTSFGNSMWTFYYLRSSSDMDLRALRLVQDLMSAQALLSIVSQALTLLVRGQTTLAQFPWPWRLPEALFYMSALLMFGLHALVLGLRAHYRGNHLSDGSLHTYVELDWFVWVVMFVLPVVGVVVGVLVNADDQHHYKRYLQFLRLEFDTRLGMHSPR